MKYTASIIPGSPVETLWRSHARVSGVLAGVAFRLSADGFVAGELTSEQVRALYHHSSVRLETFSVAPAVFQMAAPAVAPEFRPKPRAASPPPAQKRARK